MVILTWISFIVSLFLKFTETSCIYVESKFASATVLAFREQQIIIRWLPIPSRRSHTMSQFFKIIRDEVRISHKDFLQCFHTDHEFNFNAENYIVNAQQLCELTFLPIFSILSFLGINYLLKAAERRKGNEQICNSVLRSLGILFLACCRTRTDSLDKAVNYLSQKSKAVAVYSMPVGQTVVLCMRNAILRAVVKFAKENKEV